MCFRSNSPCFTTVLSYITVFVEADTIEGNMHYPIRMGGILVKTKICFNATSVLFLKFLNYASS